MTFPDRKYDDLPSYVEDYFAEVARAQASVDREAVEQAGFLLEDAYQRGATVFVCGNGGSAAIANSFVCDHGKLIQTDTDVIPRIESLSCNVPMLTAIANDLSYADVFLYQLRTQARPKDVLITISASGNSENVVRAAEWAVDHEMQVIAFTGFDGGRMKDACNLHVHVDADNYGVIEDVHQSLMHLLGHYLRQDRMPEDLIKQRKF